MWFDATNGIYSASTPLLYDVAILQQIYGANYTTRSGDTVYGYHSTAGEPSYDFTVDTTPIVTIWDGGGNLPSTSRARTCPAGST